MPRKLNFSRKEIPEKRPGLFALAMVLLVLSGITLAFDLHNFLVRSGGVIALLLSVSLIRISGIRATSNLSAKQYQWSGSEANNRPGRLTWIVAIVSLPVLGLSISFIHNDAIHGGHQRWPVYMFAGVGVVLTVAWAYIMSTYLK